MKQPLYLLLMAAATVTASAAHCSDGFEYGRKDAPDGSEWQSPGRLALNKLAPRATFYPFASIDNALKVLPEYSEYTRSLNGDWRFRWTPVPWERDSAFHKAGHDVSGWDIIPVPSSWNIAGIEKNGTLRYGKPIYVNQKVIFSHKVQPGDWRGGVMRTPPENWTTYRDRNEVGQYVRDFTIPDSWKGREVYLEFDGVDSFFYLWINGRYVGFSKNSRNAARFDITPYLNPDGNDRVAVEVYRNSDGSFLEAQDMFRLPGIFRSVRLYSTPQTKIADLRIIPEIDFTSGKGVLRIKSDLLNLSETRSKGMTIDYTLYPCSLYSDSTGNPVASATTAPINIKAGKSVGSETIMEIDSPQLWSAEKPWRYVLVAQLKDSKGKVTETVSAYTGLRQVEIRDTKAEDDEFGKAGRYYYINGRTVKLRGVNRHESMPDRGHAVTRENMLRDVMLMKRANINHVRNCHYPDDPYWYYLCEKYGIYLEDEANLESHEYYYGDASLSHEEEWRPAHVARNVEMVRSHINSPAIVIWSLGNEAGPGKNFVAAYDSIKAIDRSRPVQYERNNDIVDMGSNQYPSAEYTRILASGESGEKYPFHISEYAHSMGNAVGDLKNIWDAVESSSFVCGGAVWDWVDQSLYNYDAKSGERYLAYGGDFGDYPNDGQFVMNGLMFADLEPKPAYYEVKHVYQPFAVTGWNPDKKEVEIFNKNYFDSLDDYALLWSVWEDGVKTMESEKYSGVLPGPRQKSTLVLPYNLPDSATGEIFLNIGLRLRSDMPWAEAGYMQMEEQLPLRDATNRTIIAEAGKLRTSADGMTIKGDGFEISFNPATGALRSLEYGGRQMLAAETKLDAYRAFVNNDNWIYEDWYAKGLHNLHPTVLEKRTGKKSDGSRTVSFLVRWQAPNGAEITGGTSSGHNTIKELTEKPFTPADFHITALQTWTIHKNGAIEMDAQITPSDSAAVLPRIGYLFEVPRDFADFTYYGRGPVENYADRKSGQFIGRYTAKVDSMTVNYPKPQNMANREDVRWAALTDSGQYGFVAISKIPASVTALPYSEDELLKAPHTYQLPVPGNTRLHIDAAQTGLGGTSCGQAPPAEDMRASGRNFDLNLLILPLSPAAPLKNQILKMPASWIQPNTL